MTGLCFVFQKVPYVRVLKHILGTLSSTASCLPRLRNQLVAASFLEYSRLGNDRRQRLSSDFVAQWAATFGVMRSHTDALATETRSRKGAVRECTPSSMLKKDVTLLEPFVQCWMIGQSGRVPSTPIYRKPISSGTF